MLACAAALTATAYASPQTDFTKGEWEIEAGMSHPKAKMGSYKSAARWNFDGAVTYGLGDGYAVQYRQQGLKTKYTGGTGRELNLFTTFIPMLPFTAAITVFP